MVLRAGIGKEGSGHVCVCERTFGERTYKCDSMTRCDLYVERPELNE